MAVPAWVALAEALDGDVGSRAVRKLVSEDAAAVRDIVSAMVASPAEVCRLWHRNSAGKLTADPVQCNLVAHFFVARFFDGEAIQLRAHLIHQESEDQAHSHGASFFSHCISGAYTHEVWGKKTNAGKDQASEAQGDEAGPYYYETVRRTSSLNGSIFSESVRRSGDFVLLESLSHEHSAGGLYFFDAADVFHKVCARPEHLQIAATAQEAGGHRGAGGEAAAPIVTLVVRGKHGTFDGACFVTEGEPLPEEVRTDTLREFAGAEEEAQQFRIVQRALQAQQQGGPQAPGEQVDFGGTYREFL